MKSAVLSEASTNLSVDSPNVYVSEAAQRRLDALRSSGYAVKVRNAWGTTQATVIDVQGQTVVPATADTTLTINAQQGQSYLIKKAGDATPNVVRVTGIAATAVKRLGSRTIGVP